MPGRRKYREYSRTSVSCEKWELELLKDLKITDSEAFHLGMKQIAKKEIENHHVKQEILSEMITHQEEHIKKENERLNWLLMMRDGKLSKDKKELKYYSSFMKACEKILGGNGELGPWISKLPERDPNGDFISAWDEAAQKIGKLSGASCTPGQCMEYVRGKL